MNDDLPEPLTPADADLRDFPGTMIFRHRLWASSFNAKATDAEWRCGLNLWLASQDQKPSGSLPDDDEELCRLADLGRDLKRWLRVKAMALHGWRKCSDGRLYHPVVAEVANAQWQAKIDQRNKTLKARVAALEKRLAQATDAGARDEIEIQLQRLRPQLSQWQSRDRENVIRQAVTSSVTESVTDPVPASKRSKVKGSEVKGLVLVPFPNGNGGEAAKDMSADKPEWWPKRDRYGRVVSEITEKILFDVGKAVLGPSAGGQIQRLRKCYPGDMRAVVDLLLQADEKSDPGAWFAGVLRRAEMDERPAPQHEKFPEGIYRA